MKEFLEKNVEIIESYSKPSFIDGSKTTYYVFKINDEVYCMSYNEKSKCYVITDYDLETKNTINFYGYFSGNKVKEFIKTQKIKSSKVVQ